MTAPEPTAVERTIAEVLGDHGISFLARNWECDCGTTGRYGVGASADHQAQAVVDAIRNLPPEQMAQLIRGGSVEGRPLRLRVTDAGRIAERRPPGYRERVVGPWREVTGSATPARDLTPGVHLHTVDGHTDPCPTPGYGGRHTAVGAGAISSPYRCHGCGAWFTLNEVRDDL